MKGVIQMVKLKEMSFEEIHSAAMNALDDDSKELLEREANVELLEKIVRDKQNNSLLATSEADLVIDTILDDFSRQALRGDINSLVYLGSNDKADGKTEQAGRHEGLFLLLDEHGAVDTTGDDGGFKPYTVFRKTPNQRVTDAFYPGGGYDIKIVPKDDVTRDGTPVTYYNLTDYRFVTDQKELAIATVSNFQTLNDIVADFVEEDTYEDEVSAVLLEAIAWQWVVFDFELTDVKAVRHQVRRKEGEVWKWADPSQESFEPVVYVDDATEESQLVFAVTGMAKIGKAPAKGKEDTRKSIRAFIYFYPQRLGQHLMVCPSIDELVANKSFLTESPQNQADFMKIKLAKGKYKTLGKISNRSISADKTRLDVTIGGIQLLEQVSE
jgi:hypothetical protein